MKRALVLTLLLIFIGVLLHNAPILIRNNSYIVTNEAGQLIKSSIYPRYSFDNGITRELVIIFDDIKGSEKVLVIVPSWKLVGRPEGGDKAFKQLLPNVVYQESRARSFHQLTNRMSMIQVFTTIPFLTP